MKRYWLCIAFCALLGLCASACAAETPAESPKDATEYTRQINAALLQELPFEDRQDFEDAHRGFIATLEIPSIKTQDGRVVVDLGPFDFIRNDTAPETVNPSLWRVAQLNMQNGLFKVADRIYQIRGLDVSNMTIIEGDSGLIIIDPLVSAEVAAAGLALYYQHVPQPGSGNRPVTAVIYTHSHHDHYAGVLGVTSVAEVAAGKVAVLAPEGFLEAAVSENVFAGNAMNRRALYMYGALVPPGPKGQVDIGLGKFISAGTSGLIPPTDLIKATGEKRTLDGVEIEFQMAPGTEAPAEMLLYFPQLKALCAAEDATHTLHNIYTLRGAKARDANLWWKALDLAIDLYSNRTEVLFAQHHWPRWGQDSVNLFLANQRDGYKYLHDQTLRLANLGYTPIEISEMVTFPENLAKQWYLRDYYGTISHDVKAVYQYYLGWFDGNPANLNPLTPVEAGKRYVEMMGGAEAMLANAQKYYDKGEYRWVAQVLNHLVFAQPDNVKAKHLLADALEQLGYQAESGPWRGFYLTGAQELRSGVIGADITSIISADIISAMTPEMILDFTGAHLNPERSAGKTLALNWRQPGVNNVYAITVNNSVVGYKKGAPHVAPAATITADNVDFMELVMQAVTLDDALEKGLIKIEGDTTAIKEFFGMMDQFPLMFNIVTP